jgi:hypothetical protein
MTSQRVAPRRREHNAKNPEKTAKKIFSLLIPRQILCYFPARLANT